MISTRHLFTEVRNGIEGRSLILARGEDESKFFELVKDLELYDMTFTDNVHRAYFFSNLCSADRIKKFIKLYNYYGRSLYVE
jgi:hypothetical protein